MRILKSEKFRKWYRKLDLTQKTQIDVRLTRILLDGNYGDLKQLGSIFELRFKSGLRVYFGIDGGDLVLLLHGGFKDNKRGQTRDIELSKIIFQEYLNGK